MAGVFFSSGEVKKRPGVYNRYEQYQEAVTVGYDGTVAVTFKASWGPLGAVKTLTSAAAAHALYGSDGNTKIIDEIFNGGAIQIHAVRLGSGGTAASATLKDTTPSDAVTVTAKYAGARALKYVVRSAIGDATRKEFVLYENGAILEKISFAAGTGVDEVGNLIAAGAGSVYLNFEKVASYSGTNLVAPVATETAFSTAGADPVIANADYSAALTLLEPYSWNCLCVDSADTAVHALVSAYAARTFADGKTGFVVLGEPVSVSLTTRQAHAKAFNAYQIIYVGGGWTDSSGVTHDGWRAAAYVAGLLASTSSAKAITHSVVPGAVAPAEMLTNAQYDDCIDAGMLTFSYASGATGVWLDSGITTLVEPSGDDDAGFRKAKRVKVRFELMDKVNEAVAQLIGQVNNDADGRANVIQNVQGVLNAMAADKKLLDGATVTEDGANPATGDSAWFIISAADADALEKVYFTYRFSFGQ